MRFPSLFGWLKAAPKVVEPKVVEPPAPELPKFPAELRAKRLQELVVGEIAYIYYHDLTVNPDYTMIVYRLAETRPSPDKWSHTTRVKRVATGVEVALPFNAGMKPIDDRRDRPHLKVVRLFQMVSSDEERETSVRSFMDGEQAS